MHNISLAQFKSHFAGSPYVGIGDDFFIMDARLEERHQPLNHPCRFDGFMLLYCRKGTLKLNLNLQEFEIGEGMMFLNLPGNILKVSEIIDTPKTDVNYMCMAMSKEFIQELRLDMNRLFDEGLSLFDSPCVGLDEDEKALFADYMRLIVKVTNEDSMPHQKEAIRSLLSSLFYMLSGVLTSRLSETRKTVSSITSRGKMIFEQFVRLVSEYHSMYRNVGFYADKLCLTPKYLSKLIKETSGRSAPDWIDAYVILEAKNLLKYSNIAIKEIVYKLNFPNQSVFYKFFKARTGMTPTEYRNS